ncbi:MAG: NAD(+)/NADH kinase [Firmicutes bacterium]|nr:NAD(+)/NADH kinase [Bacillota bacterium]
MKKVGIIPNLEKRESYQATEKLVSFLNQHGCTPMMKETTAEKLVFKETACTEEELFANTDFIVLLGGDGTILDISKKAAFNKTPLLGINLGHLGFLTDTDIHGMEESVLKVINNECYIEKHMMLEADVESAFNGNGTYYCLNEFAVSRGNMVEVGVYVNDEYLDDFFGDGVLVSTPTGSTAYNLSAGGPILKPDSNSLAITPICAHTMYARSIVISAEDVVKLVINRRSHTVLTVAADGRHMSKVNMNDTVTIRKSDKYLSIIKTSKLGFYDILRQKMFNNGGR